MVPGVAVEVELPSFDGGVVPLTIDADAGFYPRSNNGPCGAMLTRLLRLPTRFVTHPEGGGPPGGRRAAAGTEEPYSHLHATLLSGQFAVTTEIGPPLGATVAPIRRKARELREWIDAANLTDGQSAVVRLGSLAASSRS